MKPIISVNNLEFHYTDEQKREIPVLKHLNLEIAEGEFVAVLGHNGSGKSTLAKHFNALLLPTGGRVTVCGLDTAAEENKLPIRQQVGMVFQNPDNQLVATIVEEDVAFGPENLGGPPKEIRERVDNALKAVGMYDYRKHAPHKLSGGQKQRVAIAGIIAMQPKCIVLDEPTAMLDPRGRKEVMQTVRRLNRELGITVVFITHFMDEAAAADRVIVINDGELCLDGTPKEVFRQVDYLRKIRLDVPQTAELVYRMRKDGFSLPEDVLTEEECICALARLLEERHV